MKFSRLAFLFFFCFVGIRAESQSVGGVVSGATTYCSSVNSGFVSLTGFTGSILNWESSIDGGLTWTFIANSTPSESYFGLSQTTCYRAIVQSGAFPPDTSTTACIDVFQPAVGGSIAGGGTFCGGTGIGTLNLTGITGTPLYWEYSTDNGVSWTTVSNTTSTYNYPNLTQTTIIQAVVENGSVCPTDTSAAVLFVVDSFSSAGAITASDTVCFGASGVLNLSAVTGAVLQWMYSTDNGLTWNAIANTSVTNPYLNASQATLYQAIVQNNSCPADTSTITLVDVYPQFAVNAGNDTTISMGQSLVLNGNGTGLPLWTPTTGLSNATIFNPSATPSATTVYQLTVADTNGCVNADFVTITVLIPEFNGMVSNLFTPNGDGINDAWYIENIQNFPDNEVAVYNIYGNKVYEKKNYMNDWQGTYNGNALPEGTYYYVLKFEDGSKPVKGSIDIIRSK